MRLQSVFGIVTCSAVGASIRLPSVTAQTLSEGDCICREGIIMDNFCINRGTLLDNSRVRTLVGPELHSQHCLLDVGVCVRSGYSVLGDPDLPGGLHSVAAQFDADGNDMVFDFAARSGARGACRDCTGELDSVRSGFRASVVGVVESAGDANSNDPLGRAPSIKVTDVRRSSEGCSNFSCPAGPSQAARPLSEGDCICREGIIMDNFCINRGTLLDNSRVRTLVGPELHSQHCLLDVGVCVRSGYSVLGDPDLPGGLHSVAAQFDADGNDMVFDFAARSGARGACRDCTGELDSVRSGFRASVVGVVESAGDANSNDPLGRAPSIKVTDVRRSSEGCSNFSCPAGPSQAARPPPTASPTAAPIAAPAPIALAPAGRPVDCNEVQTEVVLSESPRFTLSYVVNIPDTDSNADISATEADAGGFIDVQLTYEGVGYVAFGPSPTGLMPGGQVVICLPDDGDVSKYMMADRNQLAVNRMTGEQQTLIDAEVTQEDGVTTCRFRKLLVEPGEHAIESNAVNSFVWATGGINALSYHRGRGAIELPLEACTSAGVGSVEVIRAADPFEQYWRAHGILMGLAWGLFAPVAIVSAVCRRLIPGNGTWYKIHRTMNSLCFIFTVIGFAVAVAAFNGAGIDHFQFRHHQIGLTMFIVVIFQVVGGARRPHLPSPAAPSKLVQDSSKETEEEGLGAAGQTPRLSSAAAGPEPKKSTIRVAWEISHRIVGLILLVLGLSNGFTGLQLLAVRTGTESDYTNVWWGVVGTIIGIGICGAIYDRLISKSPESDSKNAHDSQRRLGLRASV